MAEKMTHLPDAAAKAPDARTKAPDAAKPRVPRARVEAPAAGHQRSGPENKPTAGGKKQNFKMEWNDQGLPVITFSSEGQGEGGGNTRKDQVPQGEIRAEAEDYVETPATGQAQKVPEGKTAEKVSSPADKAPNPGSKAPVEAGATAHAAETREAARETPKTGEDVVKEIQKSPELPKPVHEALQNPNNAHAVAVAVEEKSTFGGKVKNFLKRFGTGFVVGAAARAGLKFLSMRVLDVGGLGASAIAGGAVSGGMEAIGSFRSETKRLYDLKIYHEALAGYKDMTTLDKITAVIALETRLKKKFTGRTLNPIEQAGLHAQLSDLRSRLQAITGASSERAEDKAKIKKLLEYHTGQRTEAETVEEEGKLDALLRSFGVRNKVDREELKITQSPEVKKMLDRFYKERGLNRNWKKIGLNTLKGTVIGAAGGAAGAYVFEHFISPHIHWPAGDLNHGASGAAAHGREVVVNMPGAAAAHGADLSHAATAVHGGELTVHVPGAEDTQAMYGNVWNTVKEFMVSHGVAHPSEADINAGMLEIAKTNSVEIASHHMADASHAGHFDEAVRHFLDTKMQPNQPLTGFTSEGFKRIVEHAGGHMAGAQEIISHVSGDHLVGTHAPGEDVLKQAHDWLLAHAPKELAKQQKDLGNMWWLVGGGVAATVALVGGGYLLKQKMKKIDQEEAAHPEAKTPAAPETPNQPKIELMGGDLTEATLKRRMEVLRDIRVEALGRIQKAGMCLEGDQPDIKACERELLTLGPLIHEKQFDHLVAGASAADKEKLGEAWDALVDELQDKINVLETKVKGLKDAQEAGEENPDLDDGGDDDPTSPEPGKKPKSRETVGSSEWKTAYEAGKKKIDKKLSDAEHALAESNPEKAEESSAAGASVIELLSPVFNKLSNAEQKGAKKQLEDLRQRVKETQEKIEKAKDEQESEAAPKDDEEAKEDDVDEAEELGLQPEQLPYYRQMVELNLMVPLSEDEEFAPGDEDLKQLEKFILFAREQGNIFEASNMEQPEKLHARFKQAMIKLKNGNPRALKNLSFLILSRGKTSHQEAQAEGILDEMAEIGPKLKEVVEEAKSQAK